MPKTYEITEERNHKMKRIATAFVVCLLVSGVASAQETFSWLASPSSSAWHDSSNWSSATSEFPGEDDTDDAVTISAGTTQPVFSADSGTRTVGTIDIDADTYSTTVSLTISGGSLTTTDLVTVRSKQGLGGFTSTIAVTGGTFAPHSMEFDGRNHVTASHAIGDFDTSVTVSSSTTMKGYVDIDIADSTTVDFGDLTTSSVDSAVLRVTGHTSDGVSTLRMDSYTTNSRKASFEGPLTVECY